MVKVIVAHPAQQHSFKTAEQLHKREILDSYVTSIYLKEGSYTAKLIKFLKKDDLIRANGRKSDNIPDEKVILFCEISGLILLALRRINSLKLIYSVWWNFHNWRFNKKLIKYLDNKKDLDAVILYDQVSAAFFRKKRKAQYKKVLDMTAPYFLETYKSKYASLLDNQDSEKLHIRYKEKYLLKNVPIEISNSDGFLVASEFTKNTLIKNGVNGNKVFKCVYGIEASSNVKIDNKENNKNIISLLYIGRYTIEKGALYFSEVVKKLPSNYNITVLGEFDEESNQYKLVKDRVNFLGHVPKAKVNEIISNADFLVFPSLSDGFGLSVVESLSLGTPVICSDNAGANELIKDNYNGYSFKAGSNEELFERLITLNKSNYREFSNNAVLSVSNLTWDNYGIDLVKTLKKIIEE